MGVVQSTAERQDEIIPEPGVTRRNNAEGSYPLEVLNLYVTEECNARCWHCYQPTLNVANSERPVSPGQVDHETLLQFIQTALPLGLRSVKLTGGEPLLRSDIVELIEGINGLGLALCVESNGFFVTESLADLLAREAQMVAVSLDGGSPDRHDRLRRLPGSFDRATRAMTMLSSRGGNVQAIMTLSRVNVADLEATIAAAAGAGGRSFKINILVTLGGAKHLENSRALLDLHEMLGIYGRARELGAKYGIHVYLDGPPCFASVRDAFDNGVGACPFVNLLGVLADGSISYCGIGNSCRELIFGNIRAPGFDLHRLWREAPPLLEARRALSQKIDGVCGRCVFETSCKGSCRAFSYSEYGSLGGPHPWCQQAFEEGLFPQQYLVPVG